MKRQTRLVIVAGAVIYAACVARFVWIAFRLERAESLFRSMVDTMTGSSMDRIGMNMLALRESKVFWGAVLVAAPVAFLAILLGVRWAFNETTPATRPVAPSAAPPVAEAARPEPWYLRNAGTPGSSFREWFRGLPRKDSRRIVITLSLLLTLWIVRAFVEEAKNADAARAQAKENAAIARDSARVCTDSAIVAQQASPPAYPQLTPCGYYRRYQPGR